MKAVLISIQPKWCERIVKKKKTVEVRKSRPNMDVPFKCYIYCTKSRKAYESFAVSGKPYECGGKVIGEFVCDRIDRMVHSGTCNNDIRLRIVDKHLNCKEIDYAYLDACKLSYSDLDRYSGGRDVYGWHISDLVIYDKPKELSEFRKYISFLDGEDTAELEEAGMSKIRMKRPPQSWCYVEVLYG